MIQIIPSIWISQGKIVRFLQGDFSKGEVYDDSPMDVVKQFEDHGIEVLQLVDIDGARRGAPINYGVLETLAAHTDMKIDFAGGISTGGAIGKAFELGADYITAASVAVNDPDIFADWLVTYGRNKITLGADSINGTIAIKGWQKTTDVDLFEHIDYFYQRGLKYVKTTDVAKDGILEGPAFDLYQQIMDKFPDISLLASGGVRSIEDIERLNDMGVFAVIFGKAYFTQKIKLKDLKKFLVSS